MVSLFSQIINQSFKHMLIGTFIVFISSCISTYQLPSPTVSRYFNKGSINQAITIHEQNNLNYIPSSHDQVLYGLDMGMLNHYAGNYRLSNDFLTQAERAIENNFTRSLSRYMSSFILDDRSLDYCGEDYEDIYLNIFKALNYYNLNQPESAMVEIRRVNEKLILLKDKYNQVERRLNRSQEAKKIKKRMTLPSIQFHNSALSRYLSALFYRYEKDYDSVRIDIEHLYDAFHNQSGVYNYTMPKEIFMQYQCLQSPFPDTCFQSSGNATVRIIAFVGQSPQKKARTYWIISRKNHLVVARNKNGSQQLDLIPWKGIQSGYTFKFSVPYLKRRPHSVRQIECIIDNQRFQLSKLEDISNVAIDTFNRKKKILYFKTFVRATLKGIAAAKIKKSIEKRQKRKRKGKPLTFGEALWVEAQKSMVDAAMDLLEQSDLRISSFFPSQAFIGEALVKPGTHPVKILYYNRMGLSKTTVLKNQRITVDGLNLIESSFFDNK